MYQKRNEMPKNWPISRKGSKYIAIASHEKNKAIPLLFILRDILKVAKTRKEAKYLLMNKNVEINNKIRKDEKFPIQVFDIINLKKTDKRYRLIILNKKFKLEEISGKEAEKKIVKIIGKKILGKKKVQMNLQDGQNLITKEKFSVGDSTVINTKHRKVEKILGLKKGANIEIISGKHAGEKGQLKNIISLEKGKMYEVGLKNKKVKLPLKVILVIQ